MVGKACAVKLRWLMGLIVSGCLVFSSVWAAERITVGVFENHERYSVAADSYGLSWELLLAAAASQELVLEMQELSWNAALTRLRAGKLDLVFGAFYSEERAAWAQFSHPLIADSSAIFTTLDRTDARFEDIDFASEVVGVTQRSVQEDYAKDMGFKNIYAAMDRSQLYDMLQQQRIDYLFFGSDIISYYCLYVASSRQKGCMRQVGPTLKQNHLHAITSKNNTDGQRLIALVNQGLERLQKTEQGVKLFQARGHSLQDHRAWRMSVSQALNR